MNKLLMFILVMFASSLFADGVGTTRLMEFDNVETFLADLERNVILSEPKAVYDRIEFKGEMVEVIYFKLQEPYTNAIILGRLFTDKVLREILYQSGYKQIEVRYIVQMLLSNLNSDPTVKDVQDYCKWFYRIRAFGVPEEKIISVIQASPRGFLQGEG